MTCKSQVWQEEGAGGRRGLATDLWLIRMGGNGDLDCGKLQEVGRRVEGTEEARGHPPSHSTPKITVIFTCFHHVLF